MVRSSLKKHSQEFLNFSVGNKQVSIPYWSNKLKNGRIVTEGAFGGKATPNQIKKATQKAAKKEKLDLKTLSSDQIFYLMKRNKIGIDCSGLVYQILNSYFKKIKKLNLDKILLGSQGKRGVRRVGVKQFADPQNSTPTKFATLKPGDLIIVNQKKHIILVLDIQKNQITYIHSSHQTLKNGIHLGTLTIIHPNQDLSQQKWSDKLKNGSPYNDLIHKNDGFYRLNTLAKHHPITFLPQARCT